MADLGYYTWERLCLRGMPSPGESPGELNTLQTRSLLETFFQKYVFYLSKKKKCELFYKPFFLPLLFFE